MTRVVRRPIVWLPVLVALLLGMATVYLASPQQVAAERPSAASLLQRIAALETEVALLSAEHDDFVPETGGTFSGDVAVGGNLDVTGNIVGDNISAIGGVHVGQFPDDPAVENAGTVRWNVANNALEVSSGTDWQTLQTGAGSGSGSVFIRWGNATAPEGTTLLYSGFGYANHYTLNAPAHPIVLKSGDPGSGPGGAGYLYPLSTYDDSPPGISAQKDVIAAVCYADGPTATVWGTHSAPDGWVVLYRGYAMGGHHNHNGPADLICVECDTFDDSHPTSYAGAILYGASLAVAASGTDPTHTFIKCAVIMKAP